MSTTKTDTQRDAIDAESIDAFFTFAEDDTMQAKPQPKPVSTVVTKPAPSDVGPIAFHPRPKTYAAYRDTTPNESADWWTIALRCFSVLCFIVGIGLLVKPYFDSPNTTHTAFKPVAASSSQPRVTTRNIEDCELGQRALGKNPVRDQVETLPEPDPETSRKIVLRMGKPSGHRLDIQLIRSLSWIESVSAIEHATFYLNMEEMGAVGDAYVEAILPCPPIQEGEGNVITGIFAHEADPETRILSVTFSDGTFLKGVTDNHPFWSVDRNDFVAIGDMNEGDWVKTASGLIQITKLDARFARSGEMLYNLETHNEHVFQVTLAGILVHNNCVTLYKAPQPKYDVHDIAGNGLRKDSFPGEGAFFTTDPKIAHKYAKNYQNGVHEFRVSRAEYDKMIADGRIVVDPNEVNSLIVRPDGIDAFNSATTSRRWIDQASEDFWNLFGAP